MPGLNACNQAWEESNILGIKTCCHCGSIDAGSALVALVTNDTQYSGSDWKYGYPHKFYFVIPGFGQAKFYSKHLRDATEDQLILWNRLAHNTVQVTFEFEAETRKMFYRAPYSGFQSSGVVRR